MASEKATKYPKIGKRIWLLLRARFAKTLPTVVGPDYIISTTEMTDASARSNVLAPLRELGILDKDNKPTELAERWRHDDEYAAVCNEIRANVYPPALVEAYAEGDASQRDGIKRWFMKNSKVGDAAGKMFADTYILLSQGDLSAPEGEAKAAPQRSKAVQAQRPTPKANAAVRAVLDMPAPAPAPSQDPPTARKLPSVHIDVQVHISPDTTPEQIDRIFASMSKHLGSYIG